MCQPDVPEKNLPHYLLIITGTSCCGTRSSTRESIETTITSGEFLFRSSCQLSSLKGVEKLISKCYGISLGHYWLLFCGLFKLFGNFALLT